MRNIALMLLCASIISCGKDEKKKDEPNNPCLELGAGEGCVVSFTDSKASLDLGSPDDGTKFVVMPFSVGNPDVDDGASAAKVTFKLTASTSLTLDDSPRESSSLDTSSAAEQWMTRDHLRRSIFNRYDPEATLGADFWGLVRTSDREEKTHLERTLKDSTNAYESKARQRMLTTTDVASCEDIEGDGAQIYNLMNFAEAPKDVDVTLTETADFCIFYANGTTLVSDSSKTSIEASLTEIIARYKTIYDDTFATNTKEGYAFKPWIYVLNFKNAAHWPQTSTDPESKLQVSGLFSSVITKSTKRPTFFMASDIAAVAGTLTAAEAKDYFHATLAHEMQHAIMDYYRNWGSTDAPETVNLDEGVAHFMEDVMGYGQISFAGYPKLFLSTFKDGLTPFLSGSAYETPDAKGERGAAQAFIYYLSSQAGGVVYSSGKPTKAKGLDFVTSFVKTTDDSGISSLAAIAKSDPITLAANFLSAVVVDGLDLKATSPTFKVQEPVTTVTDTKGETGRTFGMSFNEYGGLTGRLNGYEAFGDTTTLSTGLDVGFYQTKPFVATGSGKSLAFTFESEADNASLAVVRAK